MGARLRLNVSPLEASIENGYLHVYYFDKVIREIDLKIPKVINIERQCNFVQTTFNNVLVYLKSDQYRVIIRYDGSIDLTTKDFILLQRRKINVDDLLDRNLVVHRAGSIAFGNTISPAYLAELSTGEIYLFSERYPLTVLLDMDNEINQSIYSWSKNHDDVGTMQITDNFTKGDVLIVNFGTKDYIYMDKFKVLSAHGMIGGIS